MPSIPVTFNYRSKEYSGTLSRVSGAGNEEMWHLNVNGFHFGRLFYVQGDPGFEGGLHSVEGGWRFANKDGWNKELAEYLGGIVELFYG